MIIGFSAGVTGRDSNVDRMVITPEMFTQWEDNPETVAAVDAAAEKLKTLK